MISASLLASFANIDGENNEINLVESIPEHSASSVTDLEKWGDITELSYSGGDEKDSRPCMIEFNSKLYVIWGSWGDEFSTGTDWDIVVREFNGVSWSAIYEISAPTDTGNDAHPYAIEYDGKLYVVWATTDPVISNGADWDIVIRCFDGASWGSIVEVTLPGDSVTGLDYHPKLGVYNDDLYVAWDTTDDTISNGTDTDIVVRSFDGTSWSGITELTPATNIDDDYYPNLESYGGKLYVIWYTYDTTEVTGYGNIVLKSFNGASWSDLYQVSETPYDIISLRPDVIVYDEKLCIFWQGTSGILSRYYDGLWSNIVICAETVDMFEDFEFPKVAEYNNKLFVTYETMVSSSANTDIAIIEYDGISWSNSINLSYEQNLGDDLKPVITNYDGALFVCWSTDEAGLGDGADFDIVIRNYDELSPTFLGLNQTSDNGDDGNVTLTWNAANDISTPITYNIYMSNQSNSYDFNTPNYTTTNLNYFVSNLENGQEYFFIVRAEDSLGNEDNNLIEKSIIPTSPMDNVPPFFQGIYNAVNLDTGGNVFLNWSEATDFDTIESNSDPSLPITYNIYIARNSTEQNYSTPNFTSNELNITISNLENGLEYFFVVRAEDSQGNEENNTIEKSAIPTTPFDETPPVFSGLNKANDTGEGGTVFLNWTFATDPDTNASSSDPSMPITYNIYMTNNSGEQNYASPYNTSSELNITISGLENGQEYFFVVRAQDNEKNEENNTIEKSAIPTTPTDNTPPIFSGLSSANDTCEGGSVFLNWTFATDPDTNASSSDPSMPITYNIYMTNNSGEQNYASPYNTSSELNITISGLENGQEYFFVVRAQDSSNNEENNTVEHSAVPTAPPTDTANGTENESDNDNDGLSDLLDPDDDNDGFLDVWENELGTNSTDPDDTPIDTDNDGIPDGDANNTQSWMDTDDDNDGVPDEEDYAPLDPDVTTDPNAPSGGTGNYWWIAIIIAIAALIGALLIMRKKPEMVAQEPEEQILETELCPKCGFDIEKGGACPFCVEEKPPEPEPPKTKPKFSNEEMLGMIEKSYQEGKLTEEQYLKNKQKFS